LPKLVRIETFGIADVAAVVADADHDRAPLGHQVGQVRTHVTEALYREGAAVEAELVVLGPLLDAKHQAHAGGFASAVRATRGNRLAGDHAPHGVLISVAGHVHVRVHHPNHDLAVGADVGGRDVPLGTYVVAEGVGETAGEPLHLCGGEVCRLDLDAAFAAAERDVVQGALVGHPGGESLHLIEIGLVVVAHAALVGAEQVVVLNPVALEHLPLAIVHANREVDDQLVLGLGQNVADVRLQIDDVGGLGNLLDRDVEEISAIFE
jgi:hypothetical protein